MEFGVGSIVEGKVTGITKFGAFVSLPGGRSGLVHISEVSNAFVRHPSQVVSVGDLVQVVVLEADAQRKRISLSMKQVPKQ